MRCFYEFLFNFILQHIPLIWTKWMPAFNWNHRYQWIESFWNCNLIRFSNFSGIAFNNYNSEIGWNSRLLQLYKWQWMWVFQINVRNENEIESIVGKTYSFIWNIENAATQIGRLPHQRRHIVWNTRIKIWLIPFWIQKWVERRLCTAICECVVSVAWTLNCARQTYI